MDIDTQEASKQRATENPAGPATIDLRSITDGARSPEQTLDQALDAQARFAFLADASSLLANSLDYETTLSTVAHLALPSLGAWCIVDLVEGDGSIRRLAIVHPDPARQVLARRLEEGWPPRRDDLIGAPVVIRTRRSEVIEDVDGDLLIKLSHN
jgi:hypothetical protein